VGDPDREDRQFVERIERHQQKHHRYRIGWRQHRRDGGGYDDSVPPVLRQLLERDEPGPFQDHQQDRRKEGYSKAEQEAGAEAEVVADPRQRLLLYAADIALVAEQEVKRPGHRHVISEGRAADEEGRGEDQERQERLLLLRVKARGNEFPDLDREEGEAEHQRSEQRHLHLDEECFEDVGVDDPPLPRFQQRLHQEGENRPGEIEADGEQDRQDSDRPEQAPP
jgi:hypothetical protein